MCDLHKIFTLNKYIFHKEETQILLDYVLLIVRSPIQVLNTINEIFLSLWLQICSAEKLFKLYTTSNSNVKFCW